MAENTEPPPEPCSGSPREPDREPEKSPGPDTGRLADDVPPGLFRHILDRIPLLVAHVDIAGRVTYLNAAWRTLLGREEPHPALLWTELLAEGNRPSDPGASPVLHDPWSDWVDLNHRAGGRVAGSLSWQRLDLFSGLSAARAAEGVSERGWILSCQIMTQAGLPVFKPQSSVSPGEKGEEGGMQGSAAGQEASRAGRRGTSRDILTGLPDRTAFEHKAVELLHVAASRERRLGVLRVDIDHLGDLNRLLGEEAGDQVLRVVGQRLRAIFPRAALVARTGGDEFSVLLPHDGPDGNPASGKTVCPEPDAAESAALEAASMAQSVLDLADLPIQVGATQITSGLSIGGALFPDHGRGLVALEQCAALALAEVKTHGRGGFRMWSPVFGRGESGVTRQAHSVRQMLRRDLIYPVYQAKIRLSDSVPVGIEALMRWRGAGGTADGPESLPELFRNYDLATRVSARMQERVFSDLARWYREGLVPPRMAINVAPVEFMQDDFGEKLLARLAGHGLPPTAVELELTEHVLYQNSTHFIHRALCLLHKAGVAITLDDFGTGYSSLGFLRDFPVSSVKIDRSFIAPLCEEPAMSVIVEAIIRFGQAISVDVVAEGIETEAQSAYLKRMGCPTGQGYLYCPPVAAEDMAERLRAARPGVHLPGRSPRN